MRTERDLQQALLNGRISRRDFVAKAIALGVSIPSIAAFLAACGGSSSSTPTTAAATTSASGGSTATAASGGTSSGSATAGASGAATPKASPAAQGAASEPQFKLDADQKLIIGGSKDILNLDPNQANDADSTYIYNLIHDSVALLDQQFNVKPNLATSWDISPDGLTYTYHFRKDVKFHDGSTMTADDVIFTIDRILANKYPEGRKKEKIEMIDSYKKIDDSTVEIKLKFPYGPFAAAMGVQMIVPKAAVEKMGDAEYGKKPVGAGPFKFVEWLPNDHVTLDAFPDYWMTKPRLTRITVRPIPENTVAVANLISGDVDMIGNIVGSNLKQLQADKSVNVLIKPGFSYFWAGFRMYEPPFTDVRFRQAVYYATDFDATIKAVFPADLAQRAYGTVPPGLWPQDNDYLKSTALKQDKNKSKQLFQQLISEGVMAKDYKITIAPPPDDARIKIAEVMLTNLKEVGVNAEIMRVDWAAYTPLTQSNQNLIFFLGTTPALPDPDANVRWLFGKDGTHGTNLNIAKLPDDVQWEAAIKKAQSSQNRAEREQIYRDTVRTMMQQVIHIPLYNQNALMAKKDYVKELEVNPMFQWDIVKPWANVYLSGKKK